MKYYKIIYGFDEKSEFLPITADELHKACVIAMEGGKAVFEDGFFQNRGSDVLRIVPDWHRVQGWNRGYKMTEEDFAEIRHLEKPYRETLEKGKLLAEYIIKENKRELISLPASQAFVESRLVLNSADQNVKPEIKELADKMKNNG